MTQQKTVPEKSHLKYSIAYLTSSYARAGDTFIRREVEELRHLGWTVDTFSIRRVGSSEQVSDDILREQNSTFYILEQGMWRLGITFMAMALKYPLRMGRAFRKASEVRWPGIKSFFWHLFYLVEASCLAHQLIKKDIALLHNHIAMNSGTVALLASILADIPLSMTVHGPHEFMDPEHWGLGKKIAASKLTVCISHFGKSQCMLFSPSDSWHKLQVVHCGLDNTFLNDAMSEPIKSSKLIYVGRLDPEKGTLVLVDAVARLREQNIDFELLVVGDGESRAGCEQYVKTLGLQESVHFLGWQGSDDVRRLIMDSRAMVLPSFAEGLPVVIMEALALGRPVISTYVAGIPELVKNGENGWLVSAGSVDELVIAMRSAIQTSPQTLDEMGERGRQRVLDQHSIEIEVKKLSELFATVINEEE